MPRNIFSALSLLILFVLMGACHDNEWDNLPGPIQNFVTQYFPFGEVTTYTVAANGNMTVGIDNGATLVFDSEYAWISVNGNGVPLPEIFLYDQLPSKLYNYLVEMEQTDAVYSATRTFHEITVNLLDTYITYEIESGDITYPSASLKTE